MPTILLIVVLLGLSSVGFYLGRRRALAVADGPSKKVTLHSRPIYYGALTALWCGIPGLLIFGFWLTFEGNMITRMVVADLPTKYGNLSEDRINLLVNNIKNQVEGNIVSIKEDPDIIHAAQYYRNLRSTSRTALSVAILSLAVGGIILVWSRIKPSLKARNHVETLVQCILIVCSTIAVLTTVGIVLSVLYESIRFFKEVPFPDFLFGLEWSPQTAIRKDQVGSSGAFGAIPVLLGTVLISAIAMVVAVPAGLMSAIYLSEYAGSRFRAVAKPLIEILAGIPTVVYGFFAALTVAPFIRNAGGYLGLDVSSESALAAGLVMGIMIIPFVSSLSDDFINAGSPISAGRRLQLGSHPVGDHQAGDPAGRTSRDCRRRPVGCFQSHWGDHDRGHGCGIGSQSDPKSPQGCYHGDRADRHSISGGPGIRQPKDTRGFCSWAFALPGHPSFEHYRPACGSKIPRAI